MVRDVIRFAAWKLRPPVLHGNLGELATTAALAAAVEQAPFVSVVAPAGSGKSTALAAWSGAMPERRTLWVRLDPQDDDSLVLAAALATSTRQAFGRSPRRLDQLLSSSTVPDARQLGMALALDLDELGEVVAVLDDLHHLGAGPLQLVESLIDDLGPSCRIITASRLEPPFDLPQRRVRRAVAEFTASDLRLERRQVAGLLAEVGVHDGVLTDAILERSGGWAAAAVLLAAGAASPRPADGDVPTTLAGDLDIDEYLRVEVLDQLDSTVRDFVLETSLLGLLDVATCEGLTGSEQAAELLEQVRRRGLAERVSASPGAPGDVALRYYDRIAAFLRAELARCRTREERRRLHRRAAALSPPMRAIELLVEVGDADRAGARVAEVCRTMLDVPGARVPRSWLSPFDADQLASQPWLAALSGLAAVEDGDMMTAMSQLEPAVASMRESGDHSGLVRSAVGLTEAHLALGHVTEAAALIDELLRIETSADGRVEVLMAKLWLDYFGGDWALLEAGLDEAFSLAFTSCTETGRCSVALGLGAEFLFAPRGATWLSDRAAELGRRIERDVMALTNLELIQAAAHLITGRIEQAQEASVRLDERALELGSLNWLALQADRLRMGVALATRDHRAVAAMVDAARRQLPESDRHYQERGMYAYATARSGCADGHLSGPRAARVLLGNVSAEDRPDTMVTAGVLDALICRTQGDLDGAEAALVAVGDLHRQVRFCLLTGLVDLELAAVRLESGRTAQAIETARPTLTRLARLDAVGLLLMDGPGTHRAVLEAFRSDTALGGFAERALQELAEPAPVSGLMVPETGERLTTRELDVLHLVIAGESNRRIAERLFIGERTVKSHMTSIMRKLGVTSRTAAIARCRELGTN
jgi:LuxR family maltose regulon positive regulatory protein